MSDANEDHHHDGSNVRAAPTVVVFTGGDPMRRDVAELLPESGYVIAADSGLHTALALGCAVDVVIGDLDSVTPEAVAKATASGAVIERHPVAKDKTDLELALDRALELSPTHILVVGGYGGRLDHFLANALVLTSERYAAVSIQAFVRDLADLEGHRGDPLTLLPVHGPVHGVTTEGLRYPLHGETLLPGSTRGVSNEFTSSRASVCVASGVLLVVAPRLPIGNTLR
jgi:thiamine pyrophosphokinase